MPRISVYHGDPFQFYADLVPDVTNAAQRLVSAEELSELTRLYAEYEKLQVLLKEIQERPELEWEEIVDEQGNEREI